MQPSGQATNKPSHRRWYKADLHLHTPASRDYEEPHVSYLDWLRKVVEKGLEIVAVTDHNTITGVGAIRRELEWLTRLAEQGRLTADEQQRLQMWRELSDQVLVLPGFEFTATFGFHILGIFPPETSVRHLEHVLLDLKVPAEKLDDGSTETGATTDVLTAYRIIHAAGGLAIAAHANSSHGVAMRNFPFGGQTKIAYTQDPNLDALEITDYDRRGRSTARFFSGSKAEYPRRMHCLQGSDAHRLDMDPKNPKRLGIGDRATELLLDEPTFEAIATLLRSKQFDRVRPARPADKPFDPLEVVREEGNTLLQSFHESASTRTGKLAAILADICAFANTAGGTIYVGTRPGKGKIKGLTNPGQVEKDIREGLDERMTPTIEVKIDALSSQNAKVLRVQVPRGQEMPFALDGNKFYVRDEAETSMAVRDEIVALVKESLGYEQEAAVEAEKSETLPKKGNGRGRRRTGRDSSSVSDNGTDKATPVPDQTMGETVDDDKTFYLPQVGVEIVESENRSGQFYHTIRDLRNGHIIKNVTRKGARKLWSYTIQQHEDKPIDASKVQWKGNEGLVGFEKRVGKVRYDLALREGKTIRVFYGVTDDGMEGNWAQFVQDEN